LITTPTTNSELLEENERLRLRLGEAEAVVDAIRNGIVDAVVVNSPPGESVYTLEGADRPYRLLVEAMQQGVAVLNPDGVLLYCNACLADLFKMSAQNMTVCAIDSFSAEADPAMFTDMLEDVENKSGPKEVRLRRQDGTTFPASLAISALPLQKFCLLVTDLSQQRQYDELVVSKAALLDSEIRYRRLFETAKDGILILDTDTGSITDANPFMSELLGYSHEHFLGKELWEIGLFSDKAANEAAVQTLQDKGYIRYEHLPLETNGGLRVEVEIVANAYREGHHKVIQCNIRDITERSRLTKQMHEQASELADLDHRKDEFLAMLSHELRNPLAAITNAAQLLSLQKHEDPLQQQARTIIQRQMGQLIRLVDDLMEVSRITTGRIHLQKERTGLNGIVERAAETTRPLLDQYRHELKMSLSPQPIWLHADASRLEQVVVNLITNAAKFTPEGGHISLAVQQEGDEALLRIKDTGVGIAPELLPHIFDLFTQAERSLDRSQGGLGIGLSLVQRLTEMHGGRVEVASILGQGSEFVVHFPVMLTSVSQLQFSPAEVAVEPTGPPLRLLVVDDNVDAAQALGLLLKAAGHDVRMAYDGLSAVMAALDFRPNLVLLDIGLPGIDGYEVAKRLRQQPMLQNVMLVAMTGYGQESDRQRSHEVGFDHHLVKPANFDKLQHILATVSQ
jgi:PAS domain S-box-containing protein